MTAVVGLAMVEVGTGVAGMGWVAVATVTAGAGWAAAGAVTAAAGWAVVLRGAECWEVEGMAARSRRKKIPAKSRCSSVT